MSESAVLDVAIGLALIFVVFSVAASRINESVLDVFNYRGKNLEAALARFLDGRGDGSQPAAVAGQPAGVQAVAVQPAGVQPAAVQAVEQVVVPLSQQLLDGPLKDLRTPRSLNRSAGRTTPGKATRRPSYISGQAFARGILELLGAPVDAAFAAIAPADLPASAQDEFTTLAGEMTVKNAKALQAAVAAAAATTPLTPPQQVQAGLVNQLVSVLGQDRLSQAQAMVTHWPDSEFKDTLVLTLQRVGYDRDHLMRGLAAWYDGAMDRVSGWYKRRVRLFIIGYAVVLTVAFNVDTISATRILWNNPTERATVVAAGQADTSGARLVLSKDGTLSAISGTKASTTSSTPLPIGWGDAHLTSNSWPLKVLGWLITIFALTFGAPFWFDVLGKFVNIRSGGPKPTSSISTG